jgi:hypothetical protein
MNTNLPENFKLVQLIQPRTTTGGFTSDYVSLKNCKKATMIIELTQAAAHATNFALSQAYAVAGTGAKVLTNECKIWANEDVATSDTLVRQTDAKNYTVAADIKNKTIVFEVEPSICMDINASTPFDCLAVVVANSAEATNFVSITAILETRYPQATPPAAITD